MWRFFFVSNFVKGLRRRVVDCAPAELIHPTPAAFRETTTTQTVKFVAFLQSFLFLLTCLVARPTLDCTNGTVRPVGGIGQVPVLPPLTDLNTKSDDIRTIAKQ